MRTNILIAVPFATLLAFGCRQPPDIRSATSPKESGDLQALREALADVNGPEALTNRFRVIKSWHHDYAEEACGYGPKGSKWGVAYRTTGKWGSVAWYQWQLVYDTMLAQGKISADAAAPGGRGLETAAWMTHLDSWDALGEWGMHVYELENYFDVPLNKK